MRFSFPKRRRTRLLLVVGVLLLAGGVWGARPALVKYEIWQARSALKARQAETALQWLQKAEQVDANHAETHFLLGRTYRRLGRMDKVRAHIERAWKLGWPVEQLQREQWLALAQTGQMREADLHLPTLLQNLGEDGAEICEAYVNGYFRTYRYGDAFPILDAWQADYPEDPQPFVFRGVYWQHIMNWRKAADAYRQAIEKGADPGDVGLRLAHVLIELHEYDEASRHFLRCLEEEPRRPEVLTGWARCLIEQGKWQDARNVFQQLLQEDPDHFEARLGMGNLELTAGRPDEALRWLRSAAVDRPSNRTVRYALGSALRLAGEAEAAQEHFQFASQAQKALGQCRDLMGKLALEPENTEFRYQIGQTLLKYQTSSDGHGWLLSVLEFDPDHRPTHEALADYYAAQGNEKRAAHHRVLAGHSVEADDGK